MLKKIAPAAMLAVALAWPAAGQGQDAAKSAKPKTMSGGQATSITATVEAIDTAKRELTLKGPKGNYVVMEVPEEVKRFSEIKVGDQLTIQYSEAVIVEVHKADSSAKVGMTEKMAIERGTGASPSGTVTRQMTATVEVESVDMKAPSITIKGDNGHTLAYRVQDVKNLEGVNKGDKLVITYNEAVALKIATPPAK
jgi:Cu/Ag efflux protein CusF